MKPQRIQRRRTKGWRMPGNCKYVGRPSIFGNPFTGPDGVERYREWILKPGQSWLVGLARQVLKGRNLSCWCALDQACHADVLLEIANKEL